jgi:hypothetical protein
MSTVGEIVILRVDYFATDGLARRNNSVFFNIHFWHCFSPLGEFFMATISYRVFASLSDLLSTPRFRCLLDGQNEFLPDILVSPTSVDVHHSIQFTRNRAVHFRLQLSGQSGGDAQDHWRVIPR